MNPAQIQLNKDLPEVEEFKVIKEEVTSLKKGQEEIVESIEDERSFMRNEFDKGAKKFEQIEDEMKDGFNKMFGLISSHIQESKDNKITKLTEELQTKKNRSEHIKDGVIIALVSGIAIALVLAFLSTLGVVIPK